MWRETHSALTSKSPLGNGKVTGLKSDRNILSQLLNLTDLGGSGKVLGSRGTEMTRDDGGDLGKQQQEDGGPPSRRVGSFN